MRFAERATRGPSRVLEQRHGLAEIGERGAGVLVERLRVTPPQPERDFVMAASGQFRADWDSSPVSSYPDISDEEVPSFEEMNEWGGEFESIYDGITFGIESYTECLGAAVRLRRVSSAWSRALLKRRAFLEERIDRLTSEKRTLKGIKRTAHANYSTYYAGDMYNY